MNHAKKLTPQEYEKNFKELIPPFTQTAAVAEADRCLYCYDSPCTKICPTHIDIPAFIKKISSGNLKGSAKTILESNWVALTCAKACPVEVLCEGACVFNAKGEEPIQIGRLQRYAMDNYFAAGMPKLFTPAASNGKSIGVIGSGPAGLACAAELALFGYSVIVYEAKDVPGGLDTWGIAPYKTRREDSLKEVKLVESFGVTIQTNTAAGKDISFDELMKKHDAIFIGVGLGESHSLSVPGEDLSGVVDAITYIEQVKTEEWAKVPVGKQVVVIGAGNTAVDAATESKRLGAETVTMLYRRSRNEMSAYEHEYELAKSDSITFMFLTMPKRILGTDKVEGIECLKMELGEPDAKGKRTPVPVPGTEFVIPADMVIKAIGQGRKAGFLETVPGLEIKNGKVVVDEATYRTGNPKVFAGGDCINGGKEVVNAAHDGKHAARAMHELLSV